MPHTRSVAQHEPTSSPSSSFSSSLLRSSASAQRPHSNPIASSDRANVPSIFIDTLLQPASISTNGSSTQCPSSTAPSPHPRSWDVPHPPQRRRARVHPRAQAHVPNAPPVAREPSPMRSSSSASGQDTPVRDQRPSLHSNMVGVQHILAPLRFALGSC
ncbi:hypothetical protein L1887_55782 [Cichorium endivia]|nr:hypothetical protein L1887_55782 [Cichorium endivia]